MAADDQRSAAVKPPQRYQVQGLWVETCGGGFNACYQGGSRWFANRANLVAWLRWPKGPSRDALNTWLDEIESTTQTTP
jgi:hypothetical protein